MWKTRRELLACISRSPSLRTGDRRHRCGNPHPLRCASGGPLSFFGKRKGGEERRQNQGFEILSAAEVPSASVLPTPRVGMCKFCALLSHHLCVPIRDALCACAALAGREKTSASTVRRDVGIAPYGYFEGWCRRADVGSGPYGAFNDRCAFGSAFRTTRTGPAPLLLQARHCEPVGKLVAVVRIPARVDAPQ